MPVASGNTDYERYGARHRGSGWNGDRPAAQLRESSPVPLTRRRWAARRDWNRIRRGLPYRRNETELNEGALRSLGNRPSVKRVFRCTWTRTPKDGRFGPMARRGRAEDTVETVEA